MTTELGGRPKHEPTKEQRAAVERMVAYNIKQDIIASILGIDAKTLRAKYRSELDVGKSKVTIAIANALVKKALSDHPAAVNAQKFYLERQAGWESKSQVNLNVGKASDISDAELADIARGGGGGAIEASEDADEFS